MENLIYRGKFALISFFLLYFYEKVKALQGKQKESKKLINISGFQISPPLPNFHHPLFLFKWQTRQILTLKIIETV
jgi:hypothetical protein